MPPKKTTKTTTSQKPPRRTPSPPQTSVLPEELHAQIVRRAYEIYRASYPPGRFG